MTASVTLRAALGRYRRESSFIRLFTLARHILAPLDAIAAAVPSNGPILDLGCGHGLFTNLLALGAPERELLGVDPSADKLAVARRSSRSLPNIRYQQGRIEDVAEQGFRAITILDVLYLLPDPDKLAVLRRARDLLAPDGVLLLKTNDTRPRWKYALVRAEEELMVRVLGLTHGGQIHFRGVPDYRRLLQEAGFVAQVLRIDGGRPAPHRLFICHPDIGVRTR